MPWFSACIIIRNQRTRKCEDPRKTASSRQLYDYFSLPNALPLLREKLLNCALPRHGPWGLTSIVTNEKHPLCDFSGWNHCPWRALYSRIQPREPTNVTYWPWVAMEQYLDSPVLPEFAPDDFRFCTTRSTLDSCLSREPCGSVLD